MGVLKETGELVAALQLAQREAADVIAATEAVEPDSLEALGANSIRQAAVDAQLICGNLVARLGGIPVPRKENKPLEDALGDMEEVQERLKRKASMQPPSEIEDLFETSAHGMEAKRLLDLHRDITNLIMMNNATPEQRTLQSRLTPHLPWLKKRGAVEVI